MGYCTAVSKKGCCMSRNARFTTAIWTRE